MSSDPAPLRRLRIAGLIEGTTLVALLLIAVPMKRLFGMPEPVTVIGPVHGLAFLVYFAALFEVIASASLTKREAVRAGLISFVPFGTFLNDASLRRRIAGSRQDVQ